MRALVKSGIGAGNLALREVENPSCQASEVKIKVSYASICSSDIMYWLSENEMANNRLKIPVILGHEGSGIVVETGQEVRHIKVGDRVVAETTQEVCNECNACLKTEYNNCKDRRGLGSSADGFFSEYVNVAERSVHKIPDSMSFAEAALLEPLTCVVHALMDDTTINPLEKVFVSGPGPIGLFSAQIANVCGATVYLSGTSHSLPRLLIAKDQLNIRNIINSSTEDVIARIMEETNGEGVDCAIECSGNKHSISNCLKVLSPRGRYIGLGAIHDRDDNLTIQYNNLFITRELRISGYRSTTPQSWGKTLRLARQEKIQFKPLITHKLPLEKWEEGFNLVKSKEGIKVLLLP